LAYAVVLHAEWDKHALHRAMWNSPHFVLTSALKFDGNYLVAASALLTKCNSLPFVRNFSTSGQQAPTHSHSEFKASVWPARQSGFALQQNPRGYHPDEKIERFASDALRRKP
jgi:hypothetical protein